MFYLYLVNLYILFRTKAQEEPGFELTKPSTGQDYNEQQSKMKRNSERIQGAV